MNIKNKPAKERKKSSNPIVRFTYIVVLITAIGFFIFYSIDNPDFLKNKFSSLFNNSGGEKTISDLSETDEGQSNSNIEESTTADNFGENTTENIVTDEVIADESLDNGKTTTEESIDSDQTRSSLSFWQKIKNFFIKQKNGGEDGQVYPSKLEVNFYFSVLGEEKKLVPEKRTIIAGNADIAVKNAVQELLRGPTKSYHFPLIPAGTKLIGAETYENIAKIDLSQEFLENSPDTRILDEYVIYSIVNTLTEIPGVEGVVFYIEGIRIKVYGNVDLSAPVIREKEYIDEE